MNFILKFIKIGVRKILKKYQEHKEAWEEQAILGLLEDPKLTKELKGISDDEIRDHWTVQPMLSEKEFLMEKLIIAEKLQFLRQRIGNDLKNSQVLDIGASDGIFLKSLNLPGTALNISEACVKKIRSRSIKAVRGNAEELPFPNKSFDYVFLFECLEHFENPLKALKEIARICKKTVFISIPWVKNTRVREFNYGIDAMTPENQHIFEFSEEDFKKLISYANFKISHKKYFYGHGDNKKGLKSYFINKIIRKPTAAIVFYELKFREEVSHQSVFSREIKTQNFCKSLKQFYENLAELEDIGYYFHPIGIERRQKVLTLLDPGEKDRVVDLGCGDGNISKYLAGEVRAIWGVDISTKRVRRATQKGIKAICGDVRSTPFSSNYFDKVICSEIIEHVISPEKLLREIRRLLKDDGFAVMTVPINQKLKTTLIEVPKEDLAHMTYQEIKDKHDVVDDHLHSFSEESFTQLLKQEKFNIKFINYTYKYEPRFGKTGSRFLRIFLKPHSLVSKNSIFKKPYEIIFEKLLMPLFYKRSNKKGHLIIKIVKSQS